MSDKISSTGWLPLESNPEVFQDYVKSLKGPNDIQIKDLWALEDWAFETLPKPILAIIFVFPLSEDFTKRYKNSDFQKKILSNHPDVWFTKQTIPNACGTIALLHALMNIRGRHNKYQFDPEGPLDKIRHDLEHKDPVQRAELLESATALEEAHHKAEVQGVTQPPDENPQEHFVTLLEVRGRLYELDGRMSGPIDHGPCSPESFIKDVTKVLHDIMSWDVNTQRYSALAVCEKNDN